MGLSGPQGQTPDAPEPETVKADARPSLEVIPEKSLELVRQESLEIVRESLELVRESLALELSDAPAEPALSELVAQPASAPVEAAAPVLLPEPFALVQDEDERSESERYESERYEDEMSDERDVGTPLVHMTALTTPDEISIPPVGDLVVEPVVEQFFTEGDTGEASSRHSIVAQAEEEDEWGDTPRSQKAKLKASPEAIARRAKFSRYVTMAVAGAAVVCVAAFVRSIAMPSAAKSTKSTTAVAAVAPPPPAQKAAEPAVVAPAAPVVAKEEPKPAPSEEPKAPEAKAAEPKVEEPAAAPASTPAPADDAKPVVVSDKTALEEKKISQRALDRGKVDDAIEAGERSVALDPTDGEAWLLLGASYQAKGNMKDARRCYAACLKEGKRGPVGECRAMLR